MPLTVDIRFVNDQLSVLVITITSLMRTSVLVDSLNYNDASQAMKGFVLHAG